MSSDSDTKPWRFLTNHTQVLLTISRNPDIRMREVADLVGITERATQRIVADLTEGGYISATRVGRRNHYTVNNDIKMRHPAQGNQDVGDLLSLLRHSD